MNDPVRIDLHPLGRSIQVERGTSLRDVLYAYGVEFPCGGQGRCRRCRVQLLEGTLPIGVEESAILSDREKEEGWRLACRCRVEAPVTLQVEQFRAPILVDHTPFAFQPRPGHGVAVDLGTTTLVAQLLDLETGRVLAAQTALNPQGVSGSDIMHRIQFAL
ncbi:MAG: 2Fe-2S iron-sulfur cluster-binding protein, partial [Myxococcota bacterium]|nr:2Fe-2S iron-sulfur cluster-binding protein [Myxococcota bacterium]